MVRETCQANYTGISLPKDLMNTVDKFIKINTSLDYKSRAEFVKIAIREKLENDQSMLKEIFHEDDEARLDTISHREQISQNLEGYNRREESIFKKNQEWDQRKWDVVLQKIDHIQKTIENIQNPDLQGYARDKKNWLDVKHVNNERLEEISKFWDGFIKEHAQITASGDIGRKNKVITPDVLSDFIVFLSQKGYELDSFRNK